MLFRSLVAELSGGSMGRAAQYCGDDLQGRIDAVTGLIEGATSITPSDGMAVAAALRGDRDEAVEVLEPALVVLRELVRLATGTTGYRQSLRQGQRVGRGGCRRAGL